MPNMSYINRLAFVLLVAIAASGSESAHLSARQRNFARQQALASPTPTGYPAAGVTPDIAFELPGEAEPENTPDKTYGPPDNTYGLPAAPNDEPESVPAVEQETNDEAPAQPDTKDQVQPIDEPVDNVEYEEAPEQEVVVDYAEDGSVISISTSFDQDAVNESGNKARLVYQRFPQPRRRLPPTSESLARLQQQQRVKPSKLRVLQPAQWQGW